LFLNVLYKAMRHDQDTARVKAFVKRILQICFYQKPQFVCGSLFLLSELFRGRTELRATMFDEVEVQPEMLKQLAEKAMGEIDATLQLPSPVGESSAAQPSTKNGKPKPEILIYYPGKKQLEEQQRAGKPAAPFSKVNTGADANSNEEEDGEASYPLEDSAAAIQKALAQFDLRKTPLSRYDELKRDPKFAGAGSAPCWELTLLTHHFHPSVSLWAGKLLAGDPISYPGDPLKDMALQSFLDRFMYKNPKEINRKKDSSQTQAARRMGRHYVPDRTMPVNSSAFRAKNIDDVPADELFYYKFFKQRDQQHPELATGRGRGDEDDFSGEDADFGGAVDDEELGSAEEAEIEDTLLDELEKKEGTKIKDRQKPDKEEYDYDDMEASDVEEESDLEAGSGSEMGDDEFAKMIMDEEDDDDGAMDVDDDDDGEGLLGSVDSGELDDDEDDDDELGGDEEEEEDEKPKKKKNRFGKGSFASLDEFAHLLETSGNLGEDDKQLKWEQGGMRKNKGFKRKKPDAGKSSSKKKRAPNSKKRKR
jgi:ribosome biogenesis protein MAK21